PRPLGHATPVAAGGQAVDPDGASPLQRPADGEGIRPGHVSARHQGSARHEVNPKTQIPKPKSQPETTRRRRVSSNLLAMNRFTGFLTALALALLAATEPRLAAAGTRIADPPRPRSREAETRPHAP